MRDAERHGGKTKDVFVYVHVEDTGNNVRIPRDGLRHGLDRRIGVNGPVVKKAGELLANAIKINELNPRDIDRTESTYVLVSAGKNSKGVPCIVEFVVNKASGELEDFSVLYSVNAKKESAALLPASGQNLPASLTDPDISIAKLLEYVNRFFPDSLPEEVLKHFGHKSRPEGKLGNSALYQTWENTVETGGNAIEVDTEDGTANIQFSRWTWEQSDYVTEREEAAETIAEKLGIGKKRRLPTSTFNAFRSAAAQATGSAAEAGSRRKTPAGSVPCGRARNANRASC